MIFLDGFLNGLGVTAGALVALALVFLSGAALVALSERRMRHRGR